MIRNMFGGTKCRTIDVCDIFGDNSGVALYRLDGNANDESGNYHGTETAITYGGGVYERGAVFNGSSSYISTPFIVPAISTLSFSCWVKTTSTGTRQAIIADWDGGNNNKSRLTLSLYDASTFYVSIGNETTSWVDTSISVPVAVYNGNYHHIAYTISGTTAKIYVDNVLVHTYTSTVSLGTIGTIPCYIGKLGTFAGYYMNGSIDQVRIFNRAITATEVATLYAECAPTSTVDNINPFEDGSLKALYQFNGDATDKTGTYNGTATNVTYGTGKFGQCAVFNGSASVLVNSLSYSSNQKVTISYWVKKTVSTNCEPIGFGDGSVTVGMVLNADTVSRVYWSNATSAWVNINGAKVISDGAWHHVCAVAEPNGFLKLYTDGVLESSIAINGGNTTTRTLIIGTGGAGGLNGNIDQARIFNKALTPMEVASLYNETTPMEEPMHSLVDPFKDGSGKALYRLDGNALDESGNYNGTTNVTAYVNARFGRGMSFVGGTNYLDLLVQGAKEISMWINVTSTSATRYIFDGRLTDGVAQYATIDGTTNIINLTGCAMTINGNAVISGVTVAPIGVIAHYIITLTINDTTGVTIGARYQHDNLNSMYGVIDHIRIFNRVLTAGEKTILFTEI